MMKLYYSPGACSLSPHIVAREAELAFELVKVDLKTKRTADGRDYLTINQRGYVPLLELEDGTRLSEGPAIVQFLADSAPEKSLAPRAGTLARVRLQEWLSFVGTELHKQFYWLLHAAPEQTREAQRAKVERGLAELDTSVASQQYLICDSFTVADAYAFTVVSWCKYVRIDTTKYGHLSAYMQRIGARPAVRAALEAEGLTTPRARTG